MFATDLSGPVAAPSVVTPITVIASQLSAVYNGVNGVTTTPVDTTDANLIVLYTEWNPGYGTGIVSDSFGNTWIPLTTQVDGNTAPIRIQYCANPIVGPNHTFTLIGSYLSIGFVVASGADTTPFEAESGAIAPVHVTSIQPGSLTPTLDGSLVVVGCCPITDRNAVIDSGYTNVPLIGSFSAASNMAYLVQTAKAPTNPIFSWTTPDFANMVAAVFRPLAPVAPPSCGSNMLASGVSWLSGQLQQNASEPIRYQRDNDFVDFCATLGSTLLQLSDDIGSVVMERTDRDIIFPTSLLVLAGQATLPRRGDLIHHNNGVIVETFIVLPYGTEPEFRWMDPYRQMIRLHTKRLSTQPTP